MKGKTSVRDRIETVGKQWRRTRLWTALWTGFLVLLGFIVVTAVVDLAIPLPAGLRMALWLVAAIDLAGGLVYLFVKRRDRRLTDQQAALLAEHCYPHLEDLLVSAVEFAEAPEDEDRPGVTGHLKERVVGDAGREARMLSFHSVVPRRGLRLRAMAALGVVAILGFLSQVDPVAFAREAGRILTPWRPLAPMQWTRIAVAPGDIRLRWGSDLPIGARTEGHPAEEATIHLRDLGGEWRECPMEAVGTDSFAYELFSVEESTEYAITAGDGRSSTFRVTVYEPPALRRASASYTYPAYTGLAPAVIESGNLRAVKGTRVELRAKFSKPLAEATVCLDSGDSLRPVAIEDSTARFQLVLVDSASYQFAVRDTAGYGNETPETFSIDAVPDAPPDVAIPQPGGDVWTTGSDVVPITVVATDDYGIRDATFTWCADGGVEQRRSLGEFDLPGVRQVEGAHTFVLRELGMAPGSVITYYAEATDWSDPHAPQRTASSIFMIAVRPFQQKLAGLGGMCQGACQRLSARQAGLLRATWDLVRASARVSDRDLDKGSEALAADQEELRLDLRRLLTAAEMEGDADGIAAASAMDDAELLLSEASPRPAIPHEQNALSALLRLEMKLPKRLSSGGGDGDESGAMPDSAALAEVAEDFEEREEERRKAQFRRARDLLTRARNLHRTQVTLSGEWEALGRQAAVDPAPAETEDARARQDAAARETETLSRDIEVLERALEVELIATPATASASRHMGEAAASAALGQYQRAAARGRRAQIELERATDTLFLLMARHAGELLPMLAAGLQHLGERQEKLTTQVSGMALRGPVDRAADERLRQKQEAGASQVSEMALRKSADKATGERFLVRRRQEALVASTGDLRGRLAEAARELRPLSAPLADLAQTAARAIADSLIEERMGRANAMLDQENLGRAAAEQRRAAVALRAIAAALTDGLASSGGSGLAQLIGALNGTRAAASAIQGSDGDSMGEPLDQLRDQYEPLDNPALQAGLEQLERLAAQGRGGGGSSTVAKESALAVLDSLASHLETEIRRITRGMQSEEMALEGYPPQYRELVQQYYRALAGTEVIQ